MTATATNSNMRALMMVDPVGHLTRASVATPVDFHHTVSLVDGRPLDRFARADLRPRGYRCRAARGHPAHVLFNPSLWARPDRVPPPSCCLRPQAHSALQCR